MRIHAYPCCEQPTGQPINNGYIDPRWNVPRHICFTGFITCPKCGEPAVIDLWEDTDWSCPQCVDD
jgi:hypothetical protein